MISSNASISSPSAHISQLLGPLPPLFQPLTARRLKHVIAPPSQGPKGAPRYVCWDTVFIEELAYRNGCLPMWSLLWSGRSLEVPTYIKFIQI